MQYVNDPQGRVLETYRAKALNAEGTSVENEQKIHSATYSAAGSMTSEKQWLDGSTVRETTYSEVYDSEDDNRLIRTTTYPDGGTKIERYYLNGELQKITGTAVAPVRFEYGAVEYDDVTPNLPTNCTFIKEIKLDASGVDTAEMTTTYTDMAGRMIRRQRAGLGAENWVYNSRNQLIKFVDGDSVTTLYEYNALGERVREVLDMNQNGVVNANGTDRVVETATMVAASSAPGSGAVTVSKSVVKQWQTDDSDTGTEMSIVETTPDGRKSWVKQSDVWTSSITDLLGSGNTRTTVTLPDGACTVVERSNGRTTSTVRKDDNDVQLSAQTFDYTDPYNRLVSITDARNGATTLTYYGDDQVSTVSTPDPDGAGPQTAQVTQIFHDSAGRKNKEILPDAAVVESKFTLRGELEESWGARTYPTKYTYDPQGRLKTLTTRQGGADWTSATGVAVTSWNYDSITGLLSNKRYNDNKGPDYTYTSGGKLSTRDWARNVSGGGSRVTATYGYNAAGQMTSIAYNDAGLTSSASFGYNRMGTMKSRDDAAGHTDYTYLTDGQLDDEIGGTGMFNGITLDRGVDALKRVNSLAATAVGYSTSYGFDKMRAQKVFSAGNFSERAGHRVKRECRRRNAQLKTA